MQFGIRFGKPDSYDYDTILDQFSGTKINTIRTSSVPLVNGKRRSGITGYFTNKNDYLPLYLPQRIKPQ
jgi:hypothetical protein